VLKETATLTIKVPPRNATLSSPASREEPVLLGEGSERHAYKEPPHPGDFIRTEIIKPAGLSVSATAVARQVRVKKNPI